MRLIVELVHLHVTEHGLGAHVAEGDLNLLAFHHQPVERASTVRGVAVITVLGRVTVGDLATVRHLDIDTQTFFGPHLEVGEEIVVEDHVDVQRAHLDHLDLVRELQVDRGHLQLAHTAGVHGRGHQQHCGDQRGVDAPHSWLQT